MTKKNCVESVLEVGSPSATSLEGYLQLLESFFVPLFSSGWDAVSGLGSSAVFLPCAWLDRDFIPFLLTTFYGSGAKGVSGLPPLFCLNKTSHFRVAFASILSVVCTFLAFQLGNIAVAIQPLAMLGIFLRISHPNKSLAGLTPVIAGGVLL